MLYNIVMICMNNGRQKCSFFYIFSHETYNKIDRPMLENLLVLDVKDQSFFTNLP